MEGFDEIQIRQPVTEKEKADFDKREKRKTENSEKNWVSDVESAGSFLSRVLTNGNNYSEIIPLTADGEIDSSTFMNNAGRTLLEGARSVSIDRAGLNKLIDGIKDKFKHLKFSLDENAENITLTVENEIKIGAFVHWVSQGANQKMGSMLFSTGV
jgi:hypothetical protein